MTAPMHPIATMLVVLVSLVLLMSVVWVCIPTPSKFDPNKPVEKMNRYEVMMAQHRADRELEEARARLADAKRIKAAKERARNNRRLSQQDSMLREMYTRTTGKLPPPRE